MEIDNKDTTLTTEVILSVLDNEDFEDYEDDCDEIWENSCECSPGPSSEDCKCVRQAEESLRILERELSCVRKNF